MESGRQARGTGLAGRVTLISPVPTAVAHTSTSNLLTGWHTAELTADATGDMTVAFGIDLRRGARRALAAIVAGAPSSEAARGGNPGTVRGPGPFRPAGPARLNPTRPGNG